MKEDALRSNHAILAAALGALVLAGSVACSTSRGVADSREASSAADAAVPGADTGPSFFSAADAGAPGLLALPLP